ncbi:MAG: hypothetical protein KDD69_05580 [Bdellovibrionales bacterium]|nr:hypothetical protein [Bdellovibrionales bacterium]
MNTILTWFWILLQAACVISIGTIVLVVLAVFAPIAWSYFRTRVRTWSEQRSKSNPVHHSEICLIEMESGLSYTHYSYQQVPERVVFTAPWETSPTVRGFYSHFPGRGEWIQMYTTRQDATGALGVTLEEMEQRSQTHRATLFVVTDSDRHYLRLEQPRNSIVTEHDYYLLERCGRNGDMPGILSERSPSALGREGELSREGDARREGLR